MTSPTGWTLEQTNAISRVGLIVADQREKSNLTARLDAEACQVLLDTLLTLRHERDLLAAECRAWRKREGWLFDDAVAVESYAESTDAVRAARAAVDAAGVLGREER